MKDKIFKLVGKIQHYSWGGYEYIPQLLGVTNTKHEPYAEYWMGAHQSGSATLETPDGPQLWTELIQRSTDEFLGKKVYDRFGELPYLFKILDVNEMLSIQVHPTKEEAKKGFQREESAGIPIHAPHRSYKDKNHKPEVMVALSDFWLLHGFKKEDKLQEVLDSIPEFNSLSKIFAKDGYFGLYKTVMEMQQHDVDELLLPLITREINSDNKRDQPGFWVSKLYKGKIPKGDIDRGIFSIYFFNIVELKEGEGIFQGAGVPHAYLEGQNVELMANSDNVLRGGLTPKNIDVPELLKHVTFEGIKPEILSGLPSGHEINYPVPVDDFGITAIQLQKGQEYSAVANSAETFIVMKGKANCGNLTCKRGEAFVVLPGTEYCVTGVENVLLYKAFVPAW